MFKCIKHKNEYSLRFTKKDIKGSQKHYSFKIEHHIKKSIRLLSIKNKDKKLKQSLEKELNKIYKFYWKTVYTHNPYKYKVKFNTFNATNLENWVEGLKWQRRNRGSSDVYYLTRKGEKL